MTTIMESFADAANTGRSPCACFQVRRMARAITQIYDDALRPTGLRSTQFSVLLVIGFVGREGIAAVAQKLGMDRTTLSRNLKPLIRNGYVQELSSDDARLRPYALTESGVEALDGAHAIWEDVQARIHEALGEELGALLPELSDALVNVAQA